MDNTSFEFLGFAFTVVFVYQLFLSAAWRSGVLLVASCYLLSTFTHDYVAFIPFVIFLIAGYCGLLLAKHRPKTLALALGGFVLLFMYFKRYSLIPSSLFLTFPVLTVGLSYILFRVLQLMVDLQSGEIETTPSPFKYLVYTLNFTTLVSGPIQKYQAFRSTLAEAATRRPGLLEVGYAFERIIIGFFKTNVPTVILTNAQTNALGVLAQPGGGHFVAGLIAFASYPFFLYCNFSGYIDMVIGIARLLGIELPENFNRPFSSESFIEFWSRWHITLSEWFRNYVYNPLLMGLMRKYPAENLEAVWAVLAFFFTFFLVGVWHGQTPSFLFYGVLQGFGVSANKLYQIVMAKRLGRKRFKALSSQPIYVTFARGLTFTWFTFTLLWFWSNFEQIGKFFGSLGVWRVVEVWFTIWVGASILLAAWEWVRKAFLSIQWQGVSVLESRYWRTAWDTGLVLVASAVVLLSNQPAPELVYRAF